MKLLITFLTLGSMTLASLCQAAIIRGPGAPPTSPIPSSNASDLDFAGLNYFEDATTGFSLAAGQDFLKLTFWGRYDSNIATTTESFRLRIWGPPATKPGEATVIYNSTTSFDKSDFFNDGTQYYQFTQDFSASPISVSTTGTYFVSVVGPPDGKIFSWTAVDGDGDRYRSANGGAWGLNTGNGDLAFQSEHAPEPGSIVVLSFAAVGLAFGAWRRRRKQKPATD